MKDFILCKSDDGSAFEVDIDNNGTIRLEMLRSLFGAKFYALTYTIPSTERDRIARVSDEKLVEPKGGWRT